GPHLDHVGGRAGAVGGVEADVHGSVLRAQVQPGGAAVADAELQPAAGGLHDDRAADRLADPYVPVRRLGGHPGQRAVDGGVAVGHVQPQLAGDLAEVDLAVRVPDHRRAVDLADADVAVTRGDLGVPGRAADRDVAVRGLQADSAGLFEPDVAVRGGVRDLAERSFTAQARRPLDVEAGARGQADGQLDRAALAEQQRAGPVGGRLHEPAERQVQAGLLVVADQEPAVAV